MDTERGAQDSSYSAREIYDLKEQAKAYYGKNKVPEKMEDILNSMFFDNPADVYGHLANYFETYAVKPTISKVTGSQVLDSKGQPTVAAHVSCTVKNNSKRIASATGSSENVEYDHALLQDRDNEEATREQFVTSAVELINTKIHDMLISADPTDQALCDQKIVGYFNDLKAEQDAAEAAEKENASEVTPPPAATPAGTPTKGKGGRSSAKGKNKGPPIEIIPDEPREKYIPGCNGVSAVSMATCKAAACLKDIPLYQHIAQLMTAEGCSAAGQYALPQLMVSLISGGKAAQGKQNCVKDYCIIPRHDMSAKQAVKHTTAIYNTIAKNLWLKGGVSAKYTNDTGSLCPPLDKPEQGIDLINEAVNQLGFKLNEDFFIALNCASHEIYDFDKGKYEVLGGQLKLSEEMVDFWSDLVTRYPSVIALIDPIRKQEKESWMKLCDKVSERCLVVGDFVLHRPGRLIREPAREDCKTSAAVLKLNHMNTITDVITAINQLQDDNNHIVLSAVLGDTEESLIVDMAVGCDCRFLRVGAPCRGERVTKLNRLVEIEAELEEMETLKVRDAIEFYKITPPPPPPQQEPNSPAEQPPEGKKK